MFIRVNIGLINTTGILFLTGHLRLRIVFLTFSHPGFSSGSILKHDVFGFDPLCPPGFRINRKSWGGTESSSLKPYLQLDIYFNILSLDAQRTEAIPDHKNRQESSAELTSEASKEPKNRGMYKPFSLAAI